jgi:tRNA threonylcarbamoyl adenosine modification protein YjeE
MALKRASAAATETDMDAQASSLFVALSRERAETVAAGQSLGVLVRPGDVICLSGPLGAGKTAFASGIGAGWGALERVSSPTFVFAHAHRRAADQTILIHVDCYRLEDAGQAESIGLEDILSGRHAVIIEWPERIRDWLPEDALWVMLAAPDQDEEADARRITFSAVPPGRGADLLTALRRVLTEKGAAANAAGD